MKDAAIIANAISRPSELYKKTFCRRNSPLSFPSSGPSLAGHQNVQGQSLSGSMYYGSKHKDPLWIRITVLLLFLNGSVHSAAGLLRSIENYTNPEILLVAPWPYPLTAISEAVAAVLVHHFLGFRLYRFNGKLYLYVGVMVCAVIVFGFGITAGVRAWIIPEIQHNGVGYQSAHSWHDSNWSLLEHLYVGSFGSPATNLYGMFAMPVGRIYTNTFTDPNGYTNLPREVEGNPIVSSSAD
ncbi:hypothetical protein DFS33DRAFT_1274977 [Desarmillaria ectypa]|nr:hypothetical protein DFS33DRAFT_1274977 [Desarmillaria ectypa]